MKLSELKAPQGSRTKSTRKGRGHSAGKGKTAGRGHKGQKARSGGGVRLGFEGGQMPLYRRIPKRGFNNKRFSKEFVEIGLMDLNRFEEGETVNAQALLDKRIIKDIKDGIVVLGNGEIDRSLTVQAKRFTKSAEEKIAAAGGKAEVV